MELKTPKDTLTLEWLPLLPYVLFLRPLTITSYSIKTTSKPITAREETADRDLRTDVASASISQPSYFYPQSL